MVGGVIGAVAGTKLSSKFGLQGKCKLPNPSKVLNAARSGLSKVKSGASKIISKTKQVISKGKKYKSTIKKVMKRVATEGAKGGVEGAIQNKLADKDVKKGFVSGMISGAVSSTVGAIGEWKGLADKKKVIQYGATALNSLFSNAVGALATEGTLPGICSNVTSASQSILSMGMDTLTEGLQNINPIAKGMLKWSSIVPEFTLGYIGTLN